MSSIQGDPTIGDKLLNVRRNGKDYFHSNEFILYRHYGSDPDRGVFSSGLVIDWSPKITKKSYSDSWGTWSHGSGGDFHYRGKKDSAMYGWTYLYLKQPKTITLKSSGDIYHMFLNGNYSSPFRGGSVSLKSGYNLLEVTGYNQNNVNPVDISTALANLVDLMNSSQVILPQLAGDFKGDGLSDSATFVDATCTVKGVL